MRKIRSLIFYFLVFYTLSAENYCEVFGRVTDQSGNGIHGADIFVDKKIHIVSDKWGFFDIAAVSRGNRVFRIRKTGFPEIRKSIEISREWNTIVFELSRDKNSEKITEARFLEKKNESMEFTEFADYSAENSYWNREKQKNSVEKPFFEDRVEAVKDIVEQKLCIKGQICCQETGTPVFGAIITVKEKHAVTDEYGNYVLNAGYPLPVNLSVSVDHPDYQEFRTTLKIEKQETVLDFLLKRENEGVR